MANDYFKAALGDFAVDFAAGGAIRVMADKGYTVSEICGRLDYPLSKEKVRELVWKHYLETGVITEKEPDYHSPKEHVSYERVQDEFGHSSFKQVVVKEDVIQREYVPCDFGKRIYQNRKIFEQSLEALSPKDREYILDLPWPLQTVWHVKDERMERIIKALNI